MLTRRRGLGERRGKILRWRHSNCTHYDACRRETAECSQRRSEVRAERLSSRFRLRAYRTVQTSRPVSSRSVHHGIFPDFYFYTQSLQRPHERRPMASRREQVSALFFVAWTQRRLTECFPWATEGPNPPKETQTFKKEFFWQTTSGSLPAGLNLRLPYLKNGSLDFLFIIVFSWPLGAHFVKLSPKMFLLKIQIFSTIFHVITVTLWRKKRSSFSSFQEGKTANTSVFSFLFLPPTGRSRTSRLE